MASEPGGLEADRVGFAFGVHQAVRDVSLRLRPGDSVALAGPNGSGKTTLLRLLSGALKPQSGQVRLEGRPLRQLSPALRARRIAVVPQQVDPALAFTVEAMVRMGRAPHASLLKSLARSDIAAVDDAMRATDTYGLRDKRFDELSGGEQQRVALAMAVSQGTDYLLLDEPTVHLDLHHQHALLELLQALRERRSIGVLAVMHDLNLAALYFTSLVILQAGSAVARGAPADLLSRPEALAVFKAPLHVVSHPQTGAPQGLLGRDRRPIEGDV
jgi:iron complex transport system ATP-binding protein